MVRKYILPCAFAVFCAGVAASAQTPTGQQQPQTQPSTTAQATTTLEGCVYREQDIPGRSPNVAEQAGVLEDYILVTSSGTNPSATVGTSGSATSGTGTGSATATGSASASAVKMFKLEHAQDDQLKALVGKRVTVSGKIDREASDAKASTGTTAQADKSMGPDKVNLPEFEVTAISEATGECPAKPAAIKK